MERALPITDRTGQVVQHAIRCPGCDDVHAVTTAGPRAWSFNGNTERPTFSPSLLCHYAFTNGHPTQVCHSFITDGRIQFLTDSTHHLAGQTVELPEFSWPE